MKNDFININRYINLSAAILICIPFIAYLTPLWYAYFHQHPFIFQNAWDEVNYMSYQGALGARNRPGYFYLYVVSWLQELGLSGALQNLVYETIMPPVIFYFSYVACLKLNKNHRVALCYATIILFASVLFNYSNIFIGFFFGNPNTQHFLLTGWDTYPSILRDPNPLFSYFILSLSIFLYLRFRKFVILLLPLPFLYFWVFAVYLYLLIAWVLSQNLFRERVYILALLNNIIAYLILCGIISIIFIKMDHNTARLIKEGAWYFTERKIVLPLITIVACLMYLVLKINHLFANQNKFEFWFLTLTLCSFAVCNIQLLTGFSLCIKNYIDYGGSILMGVLMVMGLELLNRNQKKFTSYLKFTVLGFIVIFTLKSQGFSFGHGNFKIDLVGLLTNSQIVKIQQDPLHAIIIGTEYAQFLPFGYAKLLAPVLSFHNAIDFVNRQCSYNELLTVNALKFIHKNYSPNDPVREEMDNRGEIVLSSLERYKRFPFKNKDYCQYAKYASNEFYIIIPDVTKRFQYFPSW